jgi:NAD(P)-dependent dehydrogenase (short-subunit alcohol dehydrogenase family)
MPQVWLITGSSRGLGRAIAHAALAAGHRLIASARNPEQLGDLVDLYGDQVRAMPLDVTDPRAAQDSVQAAVYEFGRLDVVVNNAGYGYVGSIEDTSLDDFRTQIETNLFGVINVSKAAIPVMREQQSGHMIQFSSVGDRVGAMGRAPYSAAKFGVEGFSEVLAGEMAPFGVKVSIIEPGGFRTDFAGSSTKISAGRAEYDATVGRTARMQRDYDGKQPGDPARAAKVILEIAAMREPPLRLLLGSDAYDRAERNDLAKIEEGRKWRSLSVSTDFPI